MDCHDHCDSDLHARAEVCRALIHGDVALVVRVDAVRRDVLLGVDGPEEQACGGEGAEEQDPCHE